MDEASEQMLRTAPAANQPDVMSTPQDIPKVITDAATGQTPGAAPFAGLVLSKEDIIAILRYEARGKALPITEDDVRAFLDGYECTIEGLTNKDLLDMFRKIRNNVDSWGTLEDNLVGTCLHLDCFGNRMQDKGTWCVNMCQYLLGKYYSIDWSNIPTKDLTDKEKVKKLFEDKPDYPTKKDDIALLRGIVVQLETLISQSDIYYKVTMDMETRIKTFRDGLKTCRGLINNKENLIAQHHVEADILQLKKEIDDLKKKIKDETDEYYKDIGLVFTGMVIAPIGMIITGSIFGSKAAHLRHTIDAQKDELAKKRQEMATDVAISKAISCMEGDFEGLDHKMVQAEKGARQLATVWQQNTANLKLAQQAASKIQGTHHLVEMWIDILDLKKPWEKVQGNAKMISDVIKEALQSTELRNAVLRCQPLSSRLPMTISTLMETKPITFPKIKVHDGDDLYNQINDLFNELNAKVLPDHYPNIKDITNNCYQALDQMKNSIVTIRTYSDPPPSLNAVDAYINEILADPASKNDPAKQKLLKQMENIGDATLADIINELTNSCGSLVQMKHSIEFADLTTELPRLLKYIKKRMDENEENLKIADSRLNEVMTEIDKLQKALDVLEKDNLFHLFGKMLPSEEEIKRIAKGVSGDDIAAIVAGVEILKKSIDILGNAFSALQIRKAIEYYEELKKDYSATVKKLKDDGDALREKNHEVENMQIIDKKRFFFTSILESEVEFFNTYSNLLKTYMNEDIGFHRAIMLMHSAKRELDALVLS